MRFFLSEFWADKSSQIQGLASEYDPYKRKSRSLTLAVAHRPSRIQQHLEPCEDYPFDVERHFLRPLHPGLSSPLRSRCRGARATKNTTISPRLSLISV
jgi:hypothetical protein